MENDRLSGNVLGFGLSLVVTSAFSALLVIVKETNQGLLTFMKSFGHHWVTHGVANIVLFVLLGLLLSRMNEGRGPSLNPQSLGRTVGYTVILCSLAIAGFYLIEG